MKEFKRCVVPVIEGKPDMTEIDKLCEEEGYQIEKTMYDEEDFVVRVILWREVK